jgi:hypothetical protein
MQTVSLLPKAPNILFPENLNSGSGSYSYHPILIETIFRFDFIQTKLI